MTKVSNLKKTMQNVIRHRFENAEDGNLLFINMYNNKQLYVRETNEMCLQEIQNELDNPYSVLLKLTYVEEDENNE